MKCYRVVIDVFGHVRYLEELYHEDCNVLIKIIREMS